MFSKVFVKLCVLYFFLVGACGGCCSLLMTHDERGESEEKGSRREIPDTTPTTFFAKRLRLLLFALGDD